MALESDKTKKLPHEFPRGDVLLGQLSGTGDPLPLTAVLALVLAGLRVRLSRSIVTLTTIILAITFLAYTGLSSKLNHNLARMAVELEQRQSVPVSEVRETLASLAKEDWAQILPDDPASWTDLQMQEALRLQSRAQQSGHPAAAVLTRVIREERHKRVGTKLAALLRRAGVNVEATLRQGFQDSWVIIMALLLCAVGIANATLMSVTERFREIGTMKCLGAQDALVVKLFLFESAFLGLAGALLGTVVGVLVALVAGWMQFGAFGFTQFPTVEGLGVLAYSLLAGVFLALAGTLYPAVLAARMKPVDALRIDE